MTWAPEATWDSATSQFYVYWASNLFATNDTAHTGTTYSRIMYATTKDFITFSTAAPWIDIGVDIIDTTVTYDATSKSYFRFSKTGGQIVQETSKTFFGGWTTVVKGIAQSMFGDLEGPLIFLSNVYAGVWHLWMDDTSPRGYVPFETCE